MRYVLTLPLDAWAYLDVRKWLTSKYICEDREYFLTTAHDSVSLEFVDESDKSKLSKWIVAKYEDCKRQMKTLEIAVSSVE